MTQYFYAQGSDRMGPVPLEDLRAAGITPSTLVWHEGLPDWKPASDFPELSDLFAASATPPDVPVGTAPTAPPPAPAYPTTPPAAARPPAPGQRRGAYDQLGGPPPKSYLLESILATVLCCIPFGIVAIVNASKVESRYYAGDVEQAHHYSREAYKWIKIAAITGIVVSVLWFVISFVGALGTSL